MPMQIITKKQIVALRNEKGSYNCFNATSAINVIVALRNEKGSYNREVFLSSVLSIVALRNEKGSYNATFVIVVI